MLLPWPRDSTPSQTRSYLEVSQSGQNHSGRPLQRESQPSSRARLQEPAARVQLAPQARGQQTAPGTTCGNHRANYPRHPGTSQGMVFAVQVHEPTRRAGRNRCRIPPYKRGVTGSNPVAPTRFLQLDGLFETLIGYPVTTAGNHRCTHRVWEGSPERINGPPRRQTARAY
jgi:hypothetical protein